MSDLLIKPKSGSVLVQDITPDAAGWTHVGFSVRDLAAGQTVSEAGTEQELCLVLLSGAA